MRGYSKTVIAGNVGKIDNFFPATDDKKAMIRFSVATNEKAGDKEYTEWHNVTLRGPLAEIANKYVTAGTAVLIEGQNRTRKVTGEDGTERSYMGIEGFEMRLLGGGNGETATTTTKAAAQAPAKAKTARPTPKAKGAAKPEADEDLPF